MESTAATTLRCHWNFFGVSGEVYRSKITVLFREYGNIREGAISVNFYPGAVQLDAGHSSQSLSNLELRFVQ